jgi:uncharacterized protein YjbI with pentapeptide repeats
MRHSPTLLLLATLPFAAASRADTVGNAGDPLRLIFVKGQEQAAAVVDALDVAALPASTSVAVHDWLQQNKAALANDLVATPLDWTEDAQPTCALTGRSFATAITLSFPTCRVHIDTSIDAGQLLVHEAVHHFDIPDEAFADAVAIAVYRTWLNATPGDSGFRYNPAARRCETADGVPGYNVEYEGECGGFMARDASLRNLSGKLMRGINFSFADLMRTDLSGSNLRGADLAFARLREVNIASTVFDDADLRFAFVEMDPVDPVDVAKLYFRHADLASATLTVLGRDAGSDFSFADLSSSTLELHESRSTSFVGANLSRATLAGPTSAPYGLHRPDFSHADLSFVDLSQSTIYVTGPKLLDAILRGTDLSGRDLRGVDLRYRVEAPPADQPILTGALFDATTRLPFTQDEAVARGMVFSP